VNLFLTSISVFGKPLVAKLLISETPSSNSTRSLNSSFLPLFQFCTGQWYPTMRLNTSHFIPHFVIYSTSFLYVDKPWFCICLCPFIVFVRAALVPSRYVSVFWAYTEGRGYREISQLEVVCYPLD